MKVENEDTKECQRRQKRTVYKAYGIRVALNTEGMPSTESSEGLRH